LASLELRADADEGDQMWRVDRSPAGLGGLDQLERHRDTAAREPGPLVTRCRSLTVAKVDSIVILSLHVSQGCDLRRPVVDSVADGALAA